MQQSKKQFYAQPGDSSNRVISRMKTQKVATSNDSQFMMQFKTTTYTTGASSS